MEKFDNIAKPTVIEFSPAQHAHLIPYVAAIHASCVMDDDTVATFLPPLSNERLLSWWTDRVAEIDRGDRLIWLLISEGNPSGRLEGPEVKGVVMLQMPITETGHFRGNIEKLLVHKSFRGRGGARLLMDALELGAVKHGRTKLMLDTESGSPAEVYFYPKLGYTKMGVVPEYGLSPTGELKDLAYFYKILR